MAQGPMKKKTAEQGPTQGIEKVTLTPLSQKNSRVVKKGPQKC